MVVFDDTVGYPSDSDVPDGKLAELDVIAADRMLPWAEREKAFNAADKIRRLRSSHERLRVKPLRRDTVRVGDEGRKESRIEAMGEDEDGTVFDPGRRKRPMFRSGGPAPRPGKRRDSTPALLTIKNGERVWSQLGNDTQAILAFLEEGAGGAAALLELVAAVGGAGRPNAQRQERRNQLARYVHAARECGAKVEAIAAVLDVSHSVVSELDQRGTPLAA